MTTPRASFARSATPVADELKGVTTGTGAGHAVAKLRAGDATRKAARRAGLVYRVDAAKADDAIATEHARQDQRGRRGGKSWPIGWEPEKAPGEIAPSLMESLNAEIDGYTLEEALAAIGAAAQGAACISTMRRWRPTTSTRPKMQIKLPRARMIYKRLLDRVLTQAHLGSSLRVDESGPPFLWITR